MPNRNIDNVPVSNSNDSDNVSKNCSKSEVLPNRARKSLIPLIRSLKSGHVKDTGNNNEPPPQPPRYSYHYTNQSRTKNFISPVASSVSKLKSTGNSFIRRSEDSLSSNDKISESELITGNGFKRAAFRRKLKSVHSSIIRSNDELSIETCPSPTAEGCQLTPWVKTGLKLGENGTLTIKIVGASQQALQSPLSSLVKWSLGMGKIADRTRGYFMCPICNEPFCNPAIITCGHLFCIRCVSGWFEDQDNCPCCRYPIVMKDGSNSLVAKDFSEVTSVLLSVLTAGNFYSHMKDRMIPPSPSEDFEKGPMNTENDTFSSCYYSMKVLNCVAPIFREMFQKSLSKPRSGLGRNRKRVSAEDTENVKLRNSFIAALWYLRQWLTLHHKFNCCNANRTKVTQDGVEAIIIKNFPAVTKQEAYHGSQFSRESLLTKVMSMKGPCTLGESENLSIPSLDLTNSRRRLLTSNNPTPDPPRFRFRVPSSVGFTKMFMSSFLFLVIALAVHLFDDHKDAYTLETVQFSHMDCIVFLMTVLTLLAYTETERVAFWRRQGGNRQNTNREAGMRRENRNRPGYRGGGMSNLRRIEDLFLRNY